MAAIPCVTREGRVRFCEESPLGCRSGPPTWRPSPRVGKDTHNTFPQSSGGASEWCWALFSGRTNLLAATSKVYSAAVIGEDNVTERPFESGRYLQQCCYSTARWEPTFRAIVPPSLTSNPPHTHSLTLTSLVSLFILSNFPFPWLSSSFFCFFCCWALESQRSVQAVCVFLSPDKMMLTTKHSVSPERLKGWCVWLRSLVWLSLLYCPFNKPPVTRK